MNQMIRVLIRVIFTENEKIGNKKMELIEVGNECIESPRSDSPLHDEFVKEMQLTDETEEDFESDPEFVNDDEKNKVRFHIETNCSNITMF
jgi:hypothetical protein